MLIIDGVRYNLWTPKDEEKEFHPIVKKNSKQIFGQDSIYFDLKSKLSSKSGLAGIPDAYVITLNEPQVWYVLENELSTHDVYRHIVGQVTEFMDLIEESDNQSQLVRIFCQEIDRDEEVRAFIKKHIQGEIFRNLTELLATQPTIAIIIDSKTPELEKAQSRIKRLARTEIVELKTYVRDDAPNVMAFTFEPLRKEKIIIKEPEPKIDQKSTHVNAKGRQQEFWDDFKYYAINNNTTLSLRNTRPQHWYDIAYGTAIAHISLTINSRDKELGCAIYIGDSKEYYKYLLDKKDLIENALGETLNWQELPNKKASRIIITREFNLTDKDNWSNSFQWLLSTAEKFHEIFSKHLPPR